MVGGELVSLLLDLILYKIACMIWPDEKEEEAQHSDGYYFWLEEFVDNNQDDKDLPF